MLTHHYDTPRIVLTGATIIAFISLMVGIGVRNYSVETLQDTWWVWPAAGAQAGFVVTAILVCTWIEDDPCGTIKAIIGATVAGAVLFPLLIGIGWVEWYVINFWLTIFH